MLPALERIADHVGRLLPLEISGRNESEKSAPVLDTFATVCYESTRRNGKDTEMSASRRWFRPLASGASGVKWFRPRNWHSNNNPHNIYNIIVKYVFDSDHMVSMRKT